MWSDWLVFCDCGFHSVCSRIRIRGLWQLSDGRDWLREKLGLVLMGGAVLSKFLIQFSVDGWGCVPSLLFDLRPNYGGGNEDNGDLLQRSPAHTASLSASDPAAGHHQPTPLLETPGHSWASLGQSPVGSVSPGSWCAQDLACVLQVSVSPVIRKFWCKTPGPGVYKVCLSSLSVSGGYGVWFQTQFCPSYCLAGASPLPLDVVFLFLVRSNTLQSAVVQQWPVILEFL